jgi:GNAT superfamily N-acetyltransferase
VALTRPRVRRALPEDAQRLAALSTSLGYPMSPEDATRRFAEIARHPDHALLVAEDGGRVEGWIQVSLPRIFETPRQAEIAGLVVDESARGRGLGRELVAAAEDWAREQGCRAIRVRSNVVRERAHAFYRREGFGEIKTQLVLEKIIE